MVGDKTHQLQNLFCWFSGEPMFNFRGFWIMDTLVDTTVDGSEILNNHLGCVLKPYK